MMLTRIEGGMFAVAVIAIGDADDPSFREQLVEQTRLSPGFYAGAPAVLDLASAEGCASVADFVELRATLRRAGLVLVGVRNASPAQLRAAQAVDLAQFSSSPMRRAAPPASGAAPPPSPPAKPRQESERRSRLVTRPVRSGMQIYAKDGDLVVAAPVSAGAELVADGHIHVYGALRGRAIAGALGDAEARIFVQQMEAELLAIAGRYLVNEAIPPEWIKRPAQVALVGERLEFVRGAE